MSTKLEQKVAREFRMWKLDGILERLSPVARPDFSACTNETEARAVARGLSVSEIRAIRGEDDDASIGALRSLESRLTGGVVSLGATEPDRGTRGNSPPSTPEYEQELRDVFKKLGLDERLIGVNSETELRTAMARKS